METFNKLDIKLSFARKLQNKVYDADFILAIPYGLKSFVWFTKEDERVKTYLINKSKTETTLKPVVFQTNRSLHENTVLYGTVVRYDGKEYFCIEDLIFYQGFKVTLWREKLQYLSTLLQSQVSLRKESKLILSFPVFSQNMDSLSEIMKTNKVYKPFCFIHKYFDKEESFIFLEKDKKEKEERKEEEEEKRDKRKRLEYDQTDILDILFNKDKGKEANENKRHKPNTKPKTKALLVQANLQNDIYHLFDPESQTSMGFASIPNYETSILLNKEFRKIKENQNLDALEESDDEEEFEDYREDKFVDLNKKVLFECEFNTKFRKWVPRLKIENI